MRERTCEAWELNDRTSRQEVSLSRLSAGKSLFGSESRELSPYAFVHVDLLDQDKLSSLLVQNDIALVLDLRFKPVFEAPKFDHRSIIEYFSEREVVYLDCVFYAANSEDPDELFEKYQKAFRDLSYKNFWSVCLFDDLTVESQLLAEFRTGFRTGTKAFKEVHPEVLFGRSVWKSMCLDQTSRSS